MITALLIDFGGTLDGESHWLDRFLRHYREAGLDISREQLDPAFDHATRAGYRAIRVVQRFGLSEIVRFLVGQQFEYLARDAPARDGQDGLRESLRGASGSERHRMVERITASFANDTRESLAHSRKVLAALKSSYRIGVVSNFYGNLDRILAEAGLDEFVDATIDSGRVGVFKPEAGIFQAALQALKVRAAETAMVGDSIEKDCAPAHALGLKTVWFCPRRRDDSSIATRSDYTIRALDDLVSIKW
jgi:HAD superfamily hydrolase (TIGR01549 family)